MKILYLAVSKFKSNKMLRMLIILQVIYSFFTFNFVVSRWYYDTKLDRALEKTDFTDKVLHVATFGELTMANITNFDSVFNDIKDKTWNIDGAKLGRIEETGNNTSEIVIADIDYWNVLNIPMYKGKYFSESLNEDNLYCIISYNMRHEYNIGDMYAINDFSQAEIIGIADKEARYLSFTSGGLLLNLNDIFIEADSTVFVYNKYFSPVFPNSKCYITVDENADFESVYSQCKYALRNVADVYTYDELRAKSLDYNYEAITLMNTLFIVTLVICLFGITACNLLLTLNDRSIFSLYYVCGFSWKKSLLLTAVQNIASLVIPVLLGMLVYLFVAAGMSATNFETSILNWAGSFGLMLAIFIATSIIPVLTLRKLSPMEFIRKF